MYMNLRKFYTANIISVFEILLSTMWIPCWTKWNPPSTSNKNTKPHPIFLNTVAVCGMCFIPGTNEPPGTSSSLITPTEIFTLSDTLPTTMHPDTCFGKSLFRNNEQPDRSVRCPTVATLSHLQLDPFHI